MVECIVDNICPNMRFKYHKDGEVFKSIDNYSVMTEMISSSIEVPRLNRPEKMTCEESIKFH